MTNPSVMHAAAVLLASLLAGAFVLSRRQGLPSWAWSGVLVLPILALSLQSEFRLYSVHGLMHTSIVQRLLDSSWPPECPLLAGQPLSYPFGHHVVVAWLCQLLNLDPPTAFALLNTVLLAATCGFLICAARSLDPNHRLAPWVVLLALFGWTPGTLGPLAYGLQEWLSFQPEARALPIFKFATVNSNSVGITCLAAFLACALPWLQGKGKPPHWLGLVLCVALAGLLYPMAWSALVLLSVGGCLSYTCSRSWRPRLRRSISLLSAVFLGTIPAAYYLVYLNGARSAPHAMGLLQSGEDAIRHLANLGLWLVPLGLLRLLFRPAGEEASAAVRRFLWFGAILLLLVYAGTTAPLQTEYKFLLFSVPLLGLLVAGWFQSLCQPGPGRCAVEVCLAALFLLPAGSYVVLAGVKDHASASLSTEGRQLIPASGDEANLAQWLREQTGSNCIVLDSTLIVPPFAGRSLFFAHDQPEDELAGWTLPASTYLHVVYGYSMEQLTVRAELSFELVVSPEPISDSTLLALREIAGDREVVVIGRRFPVRNKLREDPRFEFQQQFGSAAVFLLGRGK